MKRIIVAFSLVILVALGHVFGAQAQSPESIWLVADTTAYKTGETVIVAVNASTMTPVQGFTFQIRYDSGCLRPINASSPIPGMNALPLPQISGLTDGSYASTTPQTVNGVLAEVRFTALKGCQTNLMLESAALAIRNESGFAAPLAGVAIGSNTIALNIDKAVGVSQPAEPIAGSILPLEPPAAERGIFGWVMGGLAMLLIVGLLLGGFKVWRSGTTRVKPKSAASQPVVLHMKHGPQAGKSIVLKQLPCSIGRDLKNEICLNDPHIMGQHARIFAANNDYYLMDLSGNTFINGQMIRNSSAVLKPGDVIRLGKSALFVFG